MSALLVGTGAPLLSGTGLTSDVRADPAGETVDTTYELIPSAAQRHIIKRPRLTRLLASAKGRILMLVAPAGFGKTTLAREWVADKPHAWYRGTTATADVAALAAGLSESLHAIVPRAGERMIQRMRATGTPEQDVQPLAELLAEDLAHWPDDAWLVFDDYQFAMESEASEQFADMVVRLSPLRVLLATRARPTWATARRLLYGEVYEVGRNELAMTQEEAAEVLAEAHDAAAPGLVALAEGWPAVLGMAALTGDMTVPPSSLPSALHDYFAEELFQATDAPTQRSLCALAISPQIDRETIAFLSHDPTRVISEAVRLGFFTSPSPGSFELHPLLRSFLEHRSTELDVISRRETAERLTGFLIEHERWEDALALIERFFSESHFVQVAEALVLSALREARMHVLRRAVRLARRHRVDAPVVDLATAEFEYREGNWRGAAHLATHAAERLASDGLASRAWFIAGAAAHLEHRADDARAHHERALARASSPKDAFDAAWGCFLAQWCSGASDLSSEFERLVELNDGTADAELRLAHGRSLAIIASGTWRGTCEVHEAAAHLVDRAEDPLVKSAFLNSFGQCLLVVGRFEEAIAATAALESAARAHRLQFVSPFADRNRAVAAMGLQEFTRAQALLDRVDAAAARRSDPYLSAEAAILRSRLSLSQGLYAEALDAVRHEPGDCWSWERSEYLATRALTLACLQRYEECSTTCDLALAESNATEPRVLVRWAQAITAQSTGDPQTEALIESAYELTRASQHIDLFITVYRAAPMILSIVCKFGQDDLAAILKAARDARHAKTLGFEVTRPVRSAVLSQREREVLQLVARGLTNRRIAETLWVSESTVKVHVHHILKKLRVRSRAEAVARASSLDL